VEPFKNLLNPQTVRAAGEHLQRVWPAFDRVRFERQAIKGLEDLELKARAQHLAAALEATLPANFHEAADILEATLAPPRAAHEGPVSVQTGTSGLAGWVIWPMTEFVARRGLEQPERSLQALHAMTQQFSAEWALRPFIERHPSVSWPTLQRWTSDPSEHVRRLVSEGSRPRLPWGLQLKGLIADPSPTLPLLRALQDDPSDCVRRSVANHLNDIAKDHPALVADWVAEFLPGASASRRALLRHACRSLIKQGEPRVMALWGVGRPFEGRVRLTVEPSQIRLGEGVELRLRLQSTAKHSQPLLIDYAVHHVKANGQTAPKVFKGWKIELAPDERRELSKTHGVKPITTRRYHPGRHVVDLRINGKVCAEAVFGLSLE
jgi:3-methyladenine DNA glycosylase AlkC